MKDYYQIMGLPREATAVEIKRSFRQLAIRFHPDKNPSREAEATFKEINEAYEVLSDPEQKLRYDQQLRLAGHAEWQQTYVRPPARPSRPSERTIFMQGMLRYSQMLFYFGCLWSVVLAADYLLPAREIYEVVATDTSERSRLLDAHLADQLRTVEGHHFPLLFSELGYFPPRSRMVIRLSAIFGALISLENFNATYEVNNLGSIYRNLSFAPVLLFLCCAIGLLYRKGLEFHVNLGIVVFLLMILNIVILYRSIL